MSKWSAIAILAAAQFVMVLDSSVMNVSISQIVADLHTTVQGVQLAITAYTLVMAAFMLVGAKIGDIWGRDRAFAIGLAVYGVGSLTTALSPNLAVLLLGWSLVEGLGAVLVMPAVAALIAANYEGRDRAIAYAIMGGVAASAVAAGPLIGGWVTTTFSWRLVFAGETVAVIGILLLRHRMKQSPRPADPPHLDPVGAALSAMGLSLIVFAVLMSSSWGWIQPRGALAIAGVAITPLGFSAVPFLILGGLGLLWAFASWTERRERRGLDTLLDLALLKVVVLRAGLSTLFMNQFVLLGTFFVLPVYLQIVLGLNALETGLRIVPMSAMMLVAALAGPRLAAGRSVKRVSQIGFVALATGAGIILSSMEVALDTVPFSLGLAVFGAGAGLLASQLGNVIMSSVDPSRTNETGGLQGTAQNLGASFGTALIGAILLAGLTHGFVDRVQSNPAIPPDVASQIVASTTSKGLEMVSVEQAEQIATQAGMSAADAAAVAQDYGEAQLGALQNALGAVAFFAVLALWFTRKLPARAGDGASATDAPPGEPVAAVEPA